MKFMNETIEYFYAGAFITLILFVLALDLSPWVWYLSLLELTRKTKIHIFLASLGNLTWLVVIFLRFRLVLVGFIPYCGMVLMDLFFMDFSKVSEVTPWKLWLAVMLPGLANQVVCWSLYTSAFWDVHMHIPEILLPHALPEFILFFLMLVPFLVKLRMNKEAAKLRRGSVTRSGKIGPKKSKTTGAKAMEATASSPRSDGGKLSLKLSPTSSQKRKLLMAPSLSNYQEFETADNIKHNPEVEVMDLEKENGESGGHPYPSERAAMLGQNSAKNVR